MIEPDRTARREQLLQTLGVESSALRRELLTYTERTLELDPGNTPSLPLDDEPHVAAWREYSDACASGDTIRVLASRLVQLNFPVQAGVSHSEAYRAATRRGVWPSPLERRILETTGAVYLEIHATPAGHVPVITAAARPDFERLLQTLAHRNEPWPVPAAMGACMIQGLNNWDRIARHRARWQARRDRGDDVPADWSSELKRLTRHKELYQDRLIVLSRGPYSGVPAEELELEDDVWLDRSLVIRREHECTHYFTLRVLGSMRNHLLDELVADYVGLQAAFGSYRAAIAQRFLGIDGPARADGRIHHYRGELSDEAFEALGRIVRRATEEMESWSSARSSSGGDGEVADAILHLSKLTVEEIAGGDL